VLGTCVLSLGFGVGKLGSVVVLGLVVGGLGCPVSSPPPSLGDIVGDIVGAGDAIGGKVGDIVGSSISGSTQKAVPASQMTKSDPVPL